MGQDWVGAALDGLRDYGPAALFVIAALGGIGVPAPVTVTFLAAGAVARQGGPERVFLFLAAATAGATVGDGVSYAMGRWGLGGLRRRLERSRSWNRAREALEARGGTAAVLLTRFLLTPLALPTNLLCGGDRYPFLRFAGLCAVGHVIYQVGIGGIGYAVGSLRAARGVLSDLGGWAGWAVAGAAVLFGLYELTHWLGHLARHREEGAPSRHGAPSS